MIFRQRIPILPKSVPELQLTSQRSIPDFIPNLLKGIFIGFLYPNRENGYRSSCQNHLYGDEKLPLEANSLILN